MTSQRSKTKTPTPNSRICCGCKVRIVRGEFQGKTGIAKLLSGSIWSVLVDSKHRAQIHRTCLKRLPEGQVGNAA